MLHGPADGGPDLDARLAEPAADVDDGGDGDGGGGEDVLAAAGGADGEVGEVEGVP